MICNKLSLILLNIIIENQGAFVKERFIIYNITVCQVRHYGRKNVKESYIMKLDVKKAYNTIDCAFIKEMMYALKLPDKFVKLVMVCVRTQTFSQDKWLT